MRINLSQEFAEFIQLYPLKRISIPYFDDIWTWIECNPKNLDNLKRTNSEESFIEDYYTRSNIKKPPKDQNYKVKIDNDENNQENIDCLIILHGISGTAGEYFLLMKTLLHKGYRIISVQYPICGNMGDWCRSFSYFLDQLNLDSVHLYGGDLGGYFSILFAQEFPNRVKSLIICNAFISSINLPLPSIASAFLYICPQFILVKLISELFRKNEIRYSPIEDMGFESNTNNKITQLKKYESLYNESLKFVINQLYMVPHNELAGRLSFLLSGDENYSYLKLSQSSFFENKKMTFISSPDSSFEDQNLFNFINKLNNVKLAQLKYGGDFPHLSNPDDIALFCQIHLRNCRAKKYNFNDQQESPNRSNNGNPNRQSSVKNTSYDMPYPGNIIHHESSFDLEK